MEKTATPSSTKPISKRSERRSRQRRRSFERRQKEVESPVTSTSDEGDGISTLQQAEARNLEDIFNKTSGSNQASTSQGTMTTPSPPTTQGAMLVLTNQTQIKQHVALVSANISDLVHHINHSN